MGATRGRGFMGAAVLRPRRAAGLSGIGTVRRLRALGETATGVAGVLGCGCAEKIDWESSEWSPVGFKIYDLRSFGCG